MLNRISLAGALLTVLAATACAVGSPGRDPRFVPVPTAPGPTPTAAGAPVGAIIDDTTVLVTRCLQSQSGGAGDAQWLLATVAVSAAGGCESSSVIEAQLRCFDGGATAPLDPAAVMRLMDCLKAVHPDVAVAAGPRIPGGPGVGVYAGADGPGSGSLTCTSGGQVDPRRGEALPIFKTLLQFGPVVAAFNGIVEARVELLDATASGDDSKTKAAREKYDEAVRVYDLAVEAAKAGDEVPTDEVEGAKSVLEAVVDWLFGDDDATEGDQDGDTTGSDSDTDRPLPDGEGSPCESITGAIAECAAIDYETEACQMLRDQLSNPKCDPTIAYVVEGRACAVSELSAEEKAELLDNALVACWSRVQTDPDSGPGPCVLRTADGGAMYMRGPSEVCGSPIALVGDDQCVTEMQDPLAFSEALLGSRRSWIDIALFGTHPNPNPGGPRPER